MRDLLKTVHDEEPDLLCLVGPTCFGQFDHGQFKVAKQFDRTSTPRPSITCNCLPSHGEFRTRSLGSNGSGSNPSV
jgi:hypothetical protein